MLEYVLRKAGEGFSAENSGLKSIASVVLMLALVGSVSSFIQWMEDLRFAGAEVVPARIVGMTDEVGDDLINMGEATTVRVRLAYEPVGSNLTLTSSLLMTAERARELQARKPLLISYAVSSPYSIRLPETLSQSWILFSLSAALLAVAAVLCWCWYRL